MGKKSRLERSFAQKHPFVSGRKQIGTRTIERYMLVVCEGARTEPLYFQSIQSTLPRGRVVVDIEGTGRNTLSLVDEVIRLRQVAKRERNRIYDEAWAVFDKDSFLEDQFNGAITKCKNHDIQCAWSNEAFELWYVLHFQYRNTAMSRDEYRKCISDEIAKRSGKPFTYEKNDPRMFQLLKELGNEGDAIRNARKLNDSFTDQRHAVHNPCTLVFKLVESLNSLRR